MSVWASKQKPSPKFSYGYVCVTRRGLCYHELEEYSAWGSISESFDLHCGVRTGEVLIEGSRKPLWDKEMKVVFCLVLMFL